MRLFILGAVLCSIVRLAFGEPIESLEGILVYPVDPPTRKAKRETPHGNTNISEFQKFVEDKLVQQTVALEYIMKLLHSNEESTKAIVENLGDTISKPALPEKLEAQYTRRSDVDPDQDNSSRRSFTGPKPMLIPNNQGDNKISPWCAVAILCHRKMNPVCGYDDNFGYGKFDDVCHMLQVNCYWKYNFALVPSCKPVFEEKLNL